MKWFRGKFVILIHIRWDRENFKCFKCQSFQTSSYTKLEVFRLQIPPALPNRVSDLGKSGIPDSRSQKSCTCPYNSIELLLINSSWRTKVLRIVYLQDHWRLYHSRKVLRLQSINLQYVASSLYQANWMKSDQARLPSKYCCRDSIEGTQSLIRRAKTGVTIAQKLRWMQK